MITSTLAPALPQTSSSPSDVADPTTEAGLSPRARILAELSLLVQAGYPYLLLISHEDDRIKAAAEEIGTEQDRKVFGWSCVSGLHSTHGSARRKVEPQDFSEGIEDVLRYNEPSIFVVLDAHRLLDSPELTRVLKDNAPLLSQQGKTIIFVSPEERIPLELQKEIVSLQFPLPDANELMECLQSVAGEELDNSHRQLLARAALGLTLREAERAFRKAQVHNGALALDDVERIQAEKQRAIRKGGALTLYPTRQDLRQVGGMSELKSWLRTRHLAFSPAARQYGLRTPRGVLLLGVQGCGKSLCCKAIAAEWNMPLLRLDMGAVFGSFVGMSEENIRTALATAEAIAPCVLWIDEIEKGLSGLGSSDVSDAGTSSRVFSSILTWLQEREAPVFVAATANRLAGLPPELLRRGRFDEIFFVDLPNEAERREVFSIHLTRHGRDPSQFVLEPLVAATEGYTGAEIEQIVIDGLYEAFADNRELNDDDLTRVTATTVPLCSTMAEEIEALQRWAHDRARPAGMRNPGAFL